MIIHSTLPELPTCSMYDVNVPYIQEKEGSCRKEKRSMKRSLALMHARTPTHASQEEGRTREKDPYCVERRMEPYVERHSRKTLLLVRGGGVTTPRISEAVCGVCIP